MAKQQWRRRLERTLLGALMSAVAVLVERRLTHLLKRRG
jgi:hypothetical protein